MKNKYKIFKIETQTYEPGLGQSSYKKDMVGTTWAVSEKQAVNNYKFRNHITNNELYCAGMYGYERKTTFVAELA